MARRTIDQACVLITGASGGIGRSLALQLARKRARLVLLARREQRLHEVSELAIAAGAAACHFVVGDVTDAGVRRVALDCAVREYGGLDLLVNNAGVGAVGPFAEASAERLRQVMEVNFFALAEMTRDALPLLRQGQRPMIVNIGSILGHRAVPGSSEYCASKFAVRGLSQSLRAELKPLGIDVLLVSPAGTESEFWEHLVEQRGEPAFRGRPASTERVAKRIVRAIERGQRECFPTWSAMLVALAEWISPSGTEWFVSRAT